MKQIILLRHAQCHGNGYVGGQSDVSLTTEGEERAEQIASQLQDISIDQVFCSSMSRARQSIAPLIDATQGLPVIYDRRLREIDFGIFEGLTYDQISQRYPEEQLAWFADQVHHAPKNGETLEQLHRRVHSLIDNHLYQVKDGSTTLVCAHGGSLRALTCELLGLTAAFHWKFQIHRGNFSIIQLHEKNSAILHSFNTKTL